MALCRCLASVSAALRNPAAPQLHRQLLRRASYSAMLPIATRTAPPRLRTLTTMAAEPYWADDAKAKINVYNDYTIYKGKGAMGLKVIKPTWEQTGSGLKIAREGTVLLEFANALEKQKYDWENKQTFALSALECAAVLEAADQRSDRGCDFFHDPNKGGPGEGTIAKSLSIKPARDDGYFFSLNVSQGGGKSSISVPVTPPEMRLIRTLLSFLLPRLLGFDEHFQGAPTVADGGGAGAGQQEGAPF